MGDHLVYDSATGHLYYTSGNHLSNECPSLGAKGYVFYGTSGGVNVKTADEYDATGDAWTNLADAPDPARSRISCFTLDSKAYATSGNANTGLVADHDEFDPSGPTWTARTDITGTRAWNPGSDVGSTGHVFGDGSALTNDEYVVDAWSTRTNCPDRKDSAYACSIGSAAYVMCGRSTQNMDEYVIDSWSAKTDFPGSARAWVFATTVNNKIYQVGGRETLFPAAYVQDNYEYDPDTWTAKTSVPAPGRSQGRAFTIGSRGYYVGGYNGSRLSDSDSYDPSGDSWTEITAMLAARLDMGSAAI
jgi:N-acetylneuraminic acid mutarotase